MYKDGLINITSVDYSEEIIHQMQSRADQQNLSGLKYLQMDVQELDKKFQQNQFDIVVDKGLLDALLPTSQNKDADGIFRNIKFVVRDKYIVISLLQEQVLEAILSSFNSHNIHIQEIPSKSLATFVIIIKHATQQKISLKLIQSELQENIEASELKQVINKYQYNKALFNQCSKNITPGQRLHLEWFEKQEDK